MVKFIQGHWPCEILEVLPTSYRYLPLEGYGPHKGRVWTAPKYLFSDKKLSTSGLVNNIAIL